MKNYAVELRGVSYQYQGHSRSAIHDIDLKIEKGSFELFSNRADLNGYLQLTGIFPLSLLLADAIITWYFYYLLMLHSL